MTQTDSSPHCLVLAFSKKKIVLLDNWNSPKQAWKWIKITEWTVWGPVLEATACIYFI